MFTVRLLCALATASLALPAAAQFEIRDHTPAEPFTYTVPEGEPLQGLRICVDAGHGGQVWGAARGYTGGTRSAVSDLTESDANLRAALFLWNLLTQAGAEVVMTRTFESRLSADCLEEPNSEAWIASRREELNVRVRVAENSDCDLLLAIHHNAVGNRDVNFATAFFWDPEQADEEAPVPHDPANVATARALGQRIIDRLSDRLEVPTRPVRHGDYHLTRESSLPSIIVECSFMTNAEEAERLEHLHRSRLEAVAIFEAVLEQFGEEVDQ